MKGNCKSVWSTAQLHSQRDVEWLSIRGKPWNFFSPSVENSRSLWVSKTTYSIFFSLNIVSFLLSFFYCARLSYLTKTAKEPLLYKNCWGQPSALRAWRGHKENEKVATEQFIKRAEVLHVRLLLSADKSLTLPLTSVSCPLCPQANSLACQGKYPSGDKNSEVCHRSYGSCHAYWVDETPHFNQHCVAPLT